MFAALPQKEAQISGLEKAMFATLADDLTIIIPAYNEAGSIADTVRSIQAQTWRVKEIIVVDDFSNDGTGDIARALGVTVMRPPQNTGSKAGAQNFALGHVATRFTMAIDADTMLAPNAIELLLPALQENNIVAVCGFVLPQFVSSIWERGRYIEYLFAFTLYKPVQDYYGKPMISSGCFSAYKTKELKELGGWSTRTMAEDMDLTWSFYTKGYGVRFVPEALCYPIEPHNFSFMSKQLKRWSHGFAQNVRLHWGDVIHIPYLRYSVTVSVWDSVIASVAYLTLIPLLALYFHNAYFLLGYVIDLPAVLVPTLIAAKKRNEVGRALASLPAFFVLRVVNSVFVVEAFVSEFILNKHLTVYEKGH